MSHPWTSKNPFMSMWLSAANRSAGTVRGHATAAAKRQVATAQADAMRHVAAAQTEAMRQFVDFWSLQPVKSASRKRARR